MRRYTVSVDGRRFTIDVEELATGRFEVAVGELRFEASLEGEEDLPGTAISPGMPPADEARAPQPVPHVVDPARPANPSTGAVGAHAGPSRPTRVDDVSSPMPGVVLQVFVKPGAVLRRGDPILVLEAMKMRNTIRAPRPATVVEVAVEAGQPVGPGEPLVRLAPAP